MGITGSETPANLSLTIFPLGDTFPFENVGNWNNSTGTLLLLVTSDTIETNTISFRITLKNPARNPAPTVQGIRVKVKEGIEFVEQAMTLPGANDYAANSPELLRQKYPMYIDEPWFTVKKIGQDSPWPCEQRVAPQRMLSDHHHPGHYWHANHIVRWQQFYREGPNHVDQSHWSLETGHWKPGTRGLRLW
jgi:hypothetical protein